TIRHKGFQPPQKSGKASSQNSKASISPVLSSKVIVNSALSPLILRHMMIDFVGPGADAALDAFGVFKALLFQEMHGFQGANPALAVDVDGLVGVQFGKALRE